MRVAHVITDLQTGGEATILAWLLPHLESHGISSFVLCLAPNVHEPDRRNTIVMEELRDAGVDVHNLGARHKLDARVVFRLTSLVRRIRPQVVHTYLYHAGMLARPIARMLGVPKVVSSVVSTNDGMTASQVWMELQSLRLADEILVNARVIAEKISHRVPALAKAIVIGYNGIDVEWIQELPALRDSSGEGPVVAYIGRLHRAKGPDLALRILAHLRREVRDVRMVIVGEGRMLGELQLLARRLGISERVSFAGAVKNSEALAVMKGAQLVLIPSRWEGLPAVLLEAMAARVPVVASAVGGIPEIVRHGDNGLMGPPGDIVEMARLCNLILKDGSLRKSICAAGEQTAKEFRYQAMIESRLRLYLGGPGSDEDRKAL